MFQDQVIVNNIYKPKSNINNDSILDAGLRIWQSDPMQLSELLSRRGPNGASIQYHGK